MGVEFGTGNQAARKYHLEDVQHIFRALLYYFEVLNPRAFYLLTGLNAFGFYPELFHYLLRQFGHDEEIQIISYRLGSILEARIVEGGAWGHIDKTFAIFLSKVKLGWVEKQHVQVETTDNSTRRTLDNMSEDDLRMIAEKIQNASRDESGAEEVN